MKEGQCTLLLCELPIPVFLSYRLKYIVRGKRVQFSAKKGALSLENMAVDSNIRAVSSS